MSTTGIHHLVLAGAILHLGGNSRSMDAGGYATPHVFSLGMSPQYRNTMFAALSIPAHAAGIFTQEASPNLSLTPTGTLKHIHLDVGGLLAATVVQTQKDIRLWPVDALVAYLNELSYTRGTAISSRLHKILKETKDLPLPQRIENLVAEVRNLRFYKEMER